MKRNEACAFLTKLAQDELISEDASRMLFKARDVVVCEDNKILDVLADDRARSLYKSELIRFLFAFAECTFMFVELRKQARELWTLLQDNSNEEYYEKCEMMFLPTRCKNCHNFKGFEGK